MTDKVPFQIAFRSIGQLGILSLSVKLLVVIIYSQKKQKERRCLHINAQTLPLSI